MTDLRKAAEQALEALRNAEVVHMEQLNAMYALQEALAQPKREWVPLTDEEYDQLLIGDWGGSLIQRVEARLKEKNGG